MQASKSIPASRFNQNVIRHKIGLLNLVTEQGKVSKACKVTGLTRDKFYRYQSAVTKGGVDALFDSDRCKADPKNRVEPDNGKEQQGDFWPALVLPPVAYNALGVAVFGPITQGGKFVRYAGLATPFSGSGTEIACARMIEWASVEVVEGALAPPTIGITEKAHRRTPMPGG